MNDGLATPFSELNIIICSWTVCEKGFAANPEVIAFQFKISTMWRVAMPDRNLSLSSIPLVYQCWADITRVYSLFWSCQQLDCEFNHFQTNTENTGAKKKRMTIPKMPGIFFGAKKKEATIGHQGSPSAMGSAAQITMCPTTFSNTSEAVQRCCRTWQGGSSQGVDVTEPFN